KAQGDQEQQNAEKANAWTQKASGKESASSKKDSKQGNAPKGANIATLVLMLLPMTILRDARPWRTHSTKTLSQVYELTVKLGEGYKDWSEKIICDQFVKENPGSFMGAPKFPNILIHKKNPQTIVISSYNLSTCVVMEAQRFVLVAKDFLVPKYSRYGNNYYVTFNKVSHPSMAKAIVKKIGCIDQVSDSSIQPYCRSEHQVAAFESHFQVFCASCSVGAKIRDALREITITDPSVSLLLLSFSTRSLL
ncbi:hypothetical protein Ae201684P_015544, partial [Aphanomyces euteiches]